MIQTVIFDMDGVIVDTEPIHRAAYYKQFEELNISVTDKVYASFTGFSTRNTFQFLKEKFQLQHEVEDLILRKRIIFNEAFDEDRNLKLLDGVFSLIQDLYQADFQIVLASSASKKTIERVFTRFHLYPFFTHLVSGEDFPKSKPHPAIFEHAVFLSATPKERCIVIEDSTNGIKAAKSAGVFCIGYNSENSKNQDLSQADLVINHFNELNPKRIKNILV